MIGEIDKTIEEILSLPFFDGNGMQATNTNVSEFSQVSISKIRVSGLNDHLYRPIQYDDPAFKDLVTSIKEHGVLEPLVLSEDLYIISGHRRYAASRQLRLAEVPCDIRYGIRKGSEGFLKLLREFNRQRVKGVDEIIREAAVDAAASDEAAEIALTIDRVHRSHISSDPMEISGTKIRAEISNAKVPFLRAIQKVLEQGREFWPLSDRQIHYRLLNDPPLIHAKKPKSTYANDRRSYQALCDLLTRARLVGLIPWTAIADPTRPVITWKAYPSVEPFIKEQTEEFMKGYWRDYTASQPHHIEIIGEKNTIAGIIEPVAMEFCIPYTIGRGYSSLQPRHDLYNRYRQSGKKELVLLILSDHDPDGLEIGQSFCRSMRDDFGIDNIFPVRVALKRDQVDDLGLPPIMQAKQSSSNYDKFVQDHGHDVFELEAIPPEALQEILREAILSVIDTDALEREQEQERADLLALRRQRERILKVVEGA